MEKGREPRQTRPRRLRNRLHPVPLFHPWSDELRWRRGERVRWPRGLPPKPRSRGRRSAPRLTEKEAERPHARNDSAAAHFVARYAAAPDRRTSRGQRMAWQPI